MHLRVAPLTLSSLPLLALLPALLAGCAEGGDIVGSGGAATGGVLGMTGGAASGGAASGGAASGGAASGGAASGGAASGGATSGGAATGGTQGGIGGTATGGQGGSSTGGQGGGPAGGSPGSGGESATGGSGGGDLTARWGEVENPSAGCQIGPLPDFASLTADPKLPDPFKKMDGTRITSKSEWLCRREEILQQGYQFILGEKPVPPEGTVSGSVSTSMISVDVTDANGGSFTATVTMNGATQPAPAIIYYGGSGAPAPNGVAKISFTPTETQGGSGAKSGPFFTVYGSNHPAGYLVAWAWQVSRIIDVLEQNPGVIDPTKLGVTGCSRYGKGAFFAGVLDNRVALTIPVESGLGGTVGLRLVEVLGGGEWPYHGISYVRWMSEVALGPFTSGNSASADNTDKLPVDMHEMMGLIAPQGLYIVDNPSTNYAGLDREAAWVTGNVGKMVFEGLGVGDHMALQGASGTHCSWRSQYQPSLDAMIDKFLMGNDSAQTGNVASDYNGPDPEAHIAWDVPTLSGDL